MSRHSIQIQKWQSNLCIGSCPSSNGSSRASRCDRCYRKDYRSAGFYECFWFVVFAVCLSSAVIVGLATVFYGVLGIFTASSGQQSREFSYPEILARNSQYNRQRDLHLTDGFDYHRTFRKRIHCNYDDEDAQFFRQNANASTTFSPSRYIVINEARSGSSWLQEMSQMHPGIKVQFELDMMYGDEALQCRECSRPLVPDSKHKDRIPPKQHPPRACGMTIFGTPNHHHDVSRLAEQHNASLIILLRLNHVAQAISSYLHFSKRKPSTFYTPPEEEPSIPWNAKQLKESVDKMRSNFDNLLQFPAHTTQRAHVLFYEDLKARPAEVWGSLQTFLGLPAISVTDLAGLERKSTSKPSIYYLKHLPDLQSQLAGEAWAPMLNDPHYDNSIDFDQVFRGVCARFPHARLSWRNGACGNATAAAEVASLVL